LKKQIITPADKVTLTRSLKQKEIELTAMKQQLAEKDAEIMKLKESQVTSRKKKKKKR
jgi:hypothetical protein